ncbi:hypothetical protein BKA80DRAFT_26174 [Phyllosticta citrichinensis]
MTPALWECPVARVPSLLFGTLFPIFSFVIEERRISFVAVWRGAFPLFWRLVVLCTTTCIRYHTITALYHYCSCNHHPCARTCTCLLAYRTAPLPLSY